MRRLGSTVARLHAMRKASMTAMSALDSHSAASHLVPLTDFGANPGSLGALCHVPRRLPKGAPLVVVTDPASLWLTVDAPESMTGVFRRGGTMRFAVPAFPGESFTARIDAVGAGLDADTRTLPVRALVSNAAASATNGRLKAGMLASVTVAGGASTPAVLLPEDAIQLLNDHTVVFIATPDGAGGTKFTVRVVETGVRTGGQVAVMRGLRAGDVVVIAGAFRVKSQLQNGSMPDMEM